MYQAKVKNTQKYSDSQGEHIVCKGKLVLIRKKIPQGGKIPKPDGVNRIYDDNYQLDPIIISETEEIIEGDKALYKDSFGYLIFTLKTKDADRYWWEEGSCSRVENEVYKILALPEHFSDKHLQAIVDGKVKEGKVLVKCFLYGEKLIGADDPKYKDYKIYLNQQNHITLFPAKQSLEKLISKYKRDEHEDWVELKYYDFNKIIDEVAHEVTEWAKNNNY